MTVDVIKLTDTKKIEIVMKQPNMDESASIRLTQVMELTRHA
jgi:hypothetical protein